MSGYGLVLLADRVAMNGINADTAEAKVLPMSQHPFRVLLYYRYVRIEDPEAYAEEQRELCQRLELRGRILISRP